MAGLAPPPAPDHSLLPPPLLPPPMHPLSVCCSQVGAEFWRKLCSEHGINNDGIVEEYAAQVGGRWPRGVGARQASWLVGRR